MKFYLNNDIGGRQQGTGEKDGALLRPIAG
jgi:hypothetical protein